MKREELKQLNRQKILAAATDLMTHQGIRATSMKDVSSKADISIVTMYKYFPTKEELTEQVVLDFYHKRFKPIIAMADGSDATFAKIINAFKKEKKECERLLGENIFYEFQRVIKHSKIVYDYLYNTQMSLISTLIKKGRASGEINTPASDDVMLMVASWVFTYLGKMEENLSKQKIEGLQLFLQYGALGRPEDRKKPLG
ncbi:TetR/AcrR family transcriptional regulator [Fructobacillus tropaeoli]|uniref:TetR/AcrR family transcriptional regulator n=1 Tax=Fructobacillus tropaeoli TaxID=709323 RepID=UPI002D8D054A|nr:AcrR family [Fructobacillus tropaeoli]